MSRNDSDRVTPIICEGTACENTLGDLIMDTFTYIFMTPAVLALVFVVSGGFSAGPLITVMFWLVVASWIAVFVHKYVKYRRRIEAMRQGVARLLETGAPLTAVAAEAVVLKAVKFRDTQLFARTGKGEEAPCAICLDGLVGADVCVELPCRHCFHRPCMAAWCDAAAGTTCPVCRGALVGSKGPVV